MTMKIFEILVLVQPGGFAWSATGINHDIAAQGNTLDELFDTFHKTVVGELALGNRSLSHIAPAPEAYREVYEHAIPLARWCPTFTICEDLHVALNVQYRIGQSARGIVQFVQDGPCIWCGGQTNSLSAFPGDWPLHMPWGEPAGVNKFHHERCVLERLRAAQNYETLDRD